MRKGLLLPGARIDIKGSSSLAGKKAKVIRYYPSTNSYLCVLRVPGGRRERLYIPANELTYHENP